MEENRKNLSEFLKKLEESKKIQFRCHFETIITSVTEIDFEFHYGIRPGEDHVWEADCKLLGRIRELRITDDEELEWFWKQFDMNCSHHKLTTAEVMLAEQYCQKTLEIEASFQGRVTKLSQMIDEWKWCEKRKNENIYISRALVQKQKMYERAILNYPINIGTIADKYKKSRLTGSVVEINRRSA